MAHDTMRGHLKAFAATRLAPLKDYFVPPLDTHATYHHHHHHHHHHGHGHHLSSELGQVDDAKKHSWTYFTSRFSRRSNSDPGSMTTTERIVLLPGWASRRYRARTELTGRAGAPYDIELFISGYVVKHKAVNTLSRSQRAVLRLAKRFASLPKLPDLYHHGSEDTLPHETDPSTEDVEDLLSTTMLREDTTDEVEGHVLHQSPKEMNPDLSPTSTSDTSSTGFSVSITPSPITPCELASASQPKVVLAKHDHLHVHRWHSNLETRLQPFWAGVLSHRTLRVSVQPHSMTESESESASPSELDFLEQPLAASVIATDAEGAFKMRLVIPWEDLCAQIPTALGEPHREYDFFVTAELMPPPSPCGPHPSIGPCPLVSSSVPSTIMRERVPLTHSPIRVISDIDDTVKLSGIHCGARAVFHNVFVKDLEDNLIPGMGEWYSEMWRRGVRFHYVSNGPFELLPVIQDFFCLAKLPTGSVRLRSYGTRTLFSDLLSAPSDRKRDGVLEVMTSFPHSRFILIGDSGEQDLELYATVARDHPEQVLCIFIRDVNTYEDGGVGIDDPTGIRARECGKKRSPWGMSLSRGGRVSPKSSTSNLSSISPAVSRAPSETTGDYFSSKTTTPSVADTQRPYTDTLYTEPESYCNAPQASVTPSHIPTLSRLTLSESDRKRMNLQLRLWKACADIPTNVVIRVFRDPLECVEAFKVIDPHLAREST